ncbi:MAG: sigma 54-interacting transcriptional regulator [Sandaracinaceae bacterium]|nr:sigma 54-interacting transcriptional regulator [Sandaracinaceae bacterium]
MHAVRRNIRAFAALPAPVLVTGETGTGKELVARALHAESRRATGPFVAVNAAALPSTLIASELFGHVRGAFTGATNEHRGLFQQADRGTLFLDEVAELPIDLQAWLLRVLETGDVRPLGAERVRKVDVRVVVATHVDLERAVRERRFRADLYWRLAVLTIVVPSLASRRDDIKPLAEHLLDRLDLEERRTLTSEAIQVLALHPWPGNVRELRAVLMRAVALSPCTRLDAEDMIRAIGMTFRQSADHASDPFAAALVATNGNVSAAARLLGVPRTTLRDRVRGRNVPLN